MWGRGAVGEAGEGGRVGGGVEVGVEGLGAVPVGGGLVVELVWGEVAREAGRWRDVREAVGRGRPSGLYPDETRSGRRVGERDQERERKTRRRRNHDR